MQEISAVENAFITLFSNSQKAFMAIKQLFSLKQNQFLQGQIYYRAENLRANRHILICQLTSSHASIRRNEKADLATKNIAKREERQAEHLSLLTYIKKYLAWVYSIEITK